MKRTRHILPIVASSAITGRETFEQLGRGRARAVDRAVTIAALKLFASRELARSLTEEARGHSLEAKARVRLGLRALRIAEELRHSQPRARVLISFPGVRRHHEKQ